MKPCSLIIFFALSGLLRTAIVAQELPEKPFRPAGVPLTDPAYNHAAEPEYTPAELATPPVNQIQKSYLRAVNHLRTFLTDELSAVPAGPQGQGSPWFTKAMAYKTGLDTIAVSCLQSDCLNRIPDIADLLAARDVDAGAPEFAIAAAGLGNGFSPVLIHAMERRTIDLNGVVQAGDLIAFLPVFCIQGFMSEGDWEADRPGVDSAGLMILDPSTIVAHLKTRPWKEADQFVGNRTATIAFARYGTTGDGLAILKSKFASNDAGIVAKWNELVSWVATQRP